MTIYSGWHVKYQVTNLDPPAVDTSRLSSLCPFITLRPRQNGRHFPDDIFKLILLNENVRISIKISLNFFHRVLVQIMAWRRPGDKPLSEPMMLWLLTHICVTRPQSIKCNIEMLYSSSWNVVLYMCTFIYWLYEMTFRIINNFRRIFHIHRDMKKHFNVWPKNPITVVCTYICIINLRVLQYISQIYTSLLNWSLQSTK